MPSVFGARQRCITSMPSKPSDPRSTTSTSALVGTLAGPASATSWPPAFSHPRTLVPSSRSSNTATTRAMALLRAQALELASHRLGTAPGVVRLDAARAQLAQDELAADAGLVEQAQRPVRRR